MFTFDRYLYDVFTELTQIYLIRVSFVPGVAISNYLVSFLFAIIPILIWIKEKQYAKAATFFGCMFILSILATFIKYIIRQPMPNNFLINYLLPDEQYSFPSLRVAASTFVFTASALTINMSSKRILFWYGNLIALYVGVSRCMMGFNYISDIVTGWLLATIFIFIHWRLSIIIEKSIAPPKRRSSDKCNSISELNTSEIELHSPTAQSNLTVLPTNQQNNPKSPNHNQ